MNMSDYVRLPDRQCLKCCQITIQHLYKYFNTMTIKEIIMSMRISTITLVIVVLHQAFGRSCRPFVFDAGLLLLGIAGEQVHACQDPDREWHPGRSEEGLRRVQFDWIFEMPWAPSSLEHCRDHLVLRIRFSRRFAVFLETLSEISERVPRCFLQFYAPSCRSMTLPERRAFYIPFMAG